MIQNSRYKIGIIIVLVFFLLLSVGGSSFLCYGLYGVWGVFYPDGNSHGINNNYCKNVIEF